MLGAQRAGRTPPSPVVTPSAHHDQKRCRRREEDSPASILEMDYGDSKVKLEPLLEEVRERGPESDASPIR